MSFHSRKRWSKSSLCVMLVDMPSLEMGLLAALALPSSSSPGNGKVASLCGDTSVSFAPSPWWPALLMLIGAECALVLSYAGPAPGRDCVDCCESTETRCAPPRDAKRRVKSGEKMPFGGVARGWLSLPFAAGALPAILVWRASRLMLRSAGCTGAYWPPSGLLASSPAPRWSLVGWTNAVRRALRHAGAESRRYCPLFSGRSAQIEPCEPPAVTQLFTSQSTLNGSAPQVRAVSAQDPLQHFAHLRCRPTERSPQIGKTVRLALHTSPQSRQQIVVVSSRPQNASSLTHGATKCFNRHMGARFGFVKPGARGAKRCTQARPRQRAASPAGHGEVAVRLLQCVTYAARALHVRIECIVRYGQDAHPQAQSDTHDRALRHCLQRFPMCSCTCSSGSSADRCAPGVVPAGRPSRPSKRRSKPAMPSKVRIRRITVLEPLCLRGSDHIAGGKV